MLNYREDKLLLLLSQQERKTSLLTSKLTKSDLSWTKPLRDLITLRLFWRELLVKIIDQTILHSSRLRANQMPDPGKFRGKLTPMLLISNPNWTTLLMNYLFGKEDCHKLFRKITLLFSKNQEQDSKSTNNLLTRSERESLTLLLALRS